MSNHITYADSFLVKITILALFLIILFCLTVSLWRMIRTNFSLYWTSCFIAVLSGLLLSFSPAIISTPVKYWDTVVTFGERLIFVGVIFVLGRLLHFFLSRSYRGVKFIYFKHVRYFMVTFLFSMAIGVPAFYYVACRPVYAVHPSLVAGSLPPLIPVHDFYASSESEWGYQPSHDGSMVAWYGVGWRANSVIRVKKVGENTPFATLSGAKFVEFGWHPYLEQLVVYAEDRLWRIDPNKPDRNQWVDVTPRGFETWRIISKPCGPNDRLAVVSNDRDPALYDLYTILQDGSNKRLLAKNDGKTIDWYLDRDNVPRMRAERLDNGGTRYLIRDNMNDGWRILSESSPRDDFDILYPPEKSSSIYALSDRGRDHVALVVIDPRTGAENVIAGDPKADVGKIFSFADRASSPDFISFENGYPRYQAFTDAGQAFLKLVMDGNNPIDFSILGSSSDGRFVTIARSWREQPCEYFLYDLKDVKATKLGDYQFRKYKDDLAETKPVWFTARDSLEIPAFLTLPRGVEPKKLPTVVVVHGGPAGQEVWKYNHDFQFLANRGYAVLSVNFRGSTGYGKSFRAAGYGQIGKAMQDDIVDAANWLIEEGVADKDNMAIMGGSYGGYSAALAMTRDPGLFKAAIVEYAVTDLAYNMQNMPASWGLYGDLSKRYFGDPENDADLAEMRERSPLNHVNSVQGAILITAGKKDEIVGVEQSEAFEAALKAAGKKDVSAVYFEKEGHGYNRWQTAVKRARLIESFLAAHIGGRSGGFDYAEIAAEYLE